MQYPTDFTQNLRNKPICGVLSLAMVSEVTFARATEVIKNNLLSFQKRHGGKTFFEQRCNSLNELNVPFKEIKLSNKSTLHKAVARYCAPGKTYMITTSGHCVTVRNQLVADQYQIAHIDTHAARRCITRHILEIN